MPDEVVAKELRHDGAGETIARLASQRTKWRKQAANLVADRDAARAEITKLKADLASASGAATELAALKSSVKAQTHRSKFDQLAKQAGVRERALDDLWNATGLSTAAEVDDTAITKAIESQRETRDYMFSTPAAASGEEGTSFDDSPLEPPLIKPAPGRGQGGNQRATGSRFEATDSQLRNPQWCFENAGKLAAVAGEVAGLPVSQVSGKLSIL